MANHHSRSPSWSHGKQMTNDGRSSAIQSAPAVEPKVSIPPNGNTPQPMNIALNNLQGSAVEDISDFDTGAPPSPSTLTDIILTLHASLYGAKRSVEEIREMVWRYYDGDAVFDSPLVSVHGRRRIIDQFVLAFACPGIDIRSELRDVICSDFEFDGTRAGIIDHTITITFFPMLFGAHKDYSGLSATPGAPMSHGSVTPHPFANYATPTTADGSGFHRSRSGYGFAMSPATPATPFMQRTNSNGSRWSSRPRTPGIPEANAEPFSAQQNLVSPAPPSNADGVADNEFGPMLRSSEPEQLDTSELPVSGTHDPVSTPMPIDTRPAMPLDAGIPRWSAQGLGRNSIWVLLVNLISPRRTLRSLFSIELRLLSRLEFNEAGRIVRHEDSWSMREMIDGIFPVFSLLYNLERFLMGLWTSWLIRLLY
ncbi:hypothetical protein MBRA1_001695 [Malassezia brasiliensis]|uniref:Uncharacterized protein n=1 Tax=Malassezia brasiliensis TaxID=1821822 RepID=A0AAF0ING1_9BASI|nr:hypothetical protein MBRA1_001695 [Malassezia brasiliensis]